MSLSGKYVTYNLKLRNHSLYGEQKVKNIITLGFIAGLLLSFLAQASSNNLKLEQNKSLVRSFYELAFNQHRPTEAVQKYIGSKYIQHNPFVPDGGEVFAKYFEEFFKEHPESKVEIKRILADGDLVILHLHSQISNADRGKAVVDIFRVENDKIVEHWDAVQDIPESSANSNTMF